MPGHATTRHMTSHDMTSTPNYIELHGFVSSYFAFINWITTSTYMNYIAINYINSSTLVVYLSMSPFVWWFTPLSKWVISTLRGKRSHIFIVRLYTYMYISINTNIHVFTCMNVHI